jgi:hypothetical protein
MSSGCVVAIVSQSSVSRLTTTSRVARGTATRYAFRLAWRFSWAGAPEPSRRFGGIPDTSRGAAKVSQKSPWIDHKVSFRCGDRSARWLPSSGTCWPILRSAFTTSGPTSTTTASAGNARIVTTSANSKHWTTRSPSSLPPDHGFPRPSSATYQGRAGGSARSSPA